MAAASAGLRPPPVLQHGLGGLARRRCRRSSAGPVAPAAPGAAGVSALPVRRRRGLGLAPRRSSGGLGRGRPGVRGRRRASSRSAPRHPAGLGIARPGRRRVPGAGRFAPRRTEGGVRAVEARTCGDGRGARVARGRLARCGSLRPGGILRARANGSRRGRTGSHDGTGGRTPATCKSRAIPGPKSLHNQCQHRRPAAGSG